MFPCAAGRDIILKRSIIYHASGKALESEGPLLSEKELFIQGWPLINRDRDVLGRDDGSLSLDSARKQSELQRHFPARNEEPCVRHSEDENPIVACHFYAKLRQFQPPRLMFRTVSGRPAVAGPGKLRKCFRLIVSGHMDS